MPGKSKNMSQSIGSRRYTNDRHSLLVSIGTGFSFRERVDLGLYHSLFGRVSLSDPAICKAAVRSLPESGDMCLSLPIINQPVVIQMGYS